MRIGRAPAADSRFGGIINAYIRADEDVVGALVPILYSSVARR